MSRKNEIGIAFKKRLKTAFRLKEDRAQEKEFKKVV